MKTAMQDMIQFLEENCMDGATEPKEILFKAFELQDKEKKQISDAWEFGKSAGYANADYTVGDYFNEIFNS